MATKPVEFEKKEPEKIWKPSKEESKTLEFVEKRIIDMVNARNALGLEAKWDDWDKQISTDEAIRSAELNIQNPSKVKKSLTRETVFAVLAMTVARNSMLELTPQDEQDKKLAPVFQAISDYLDEKAKEKITKIKNSYSTLTYGTGIRKRIYRSDTRKIKEIKSYDPETEEIKYEEKTIEDFKDIDLQNIDIRMFYPDDRATSMDDARDTAERKIIAYDSLESDYPVKKYPNVIYAKPGGWQFSVDDEKRSTPVFTDVGTDKIEIWDYYNKEKDLHVIIAGGVLLTKPDGPNPYKHKELPYARSIFQFKSDKSFWGVGLPELVKHDQALLDTLNNMMIDWMKLLINKPCLRSGGETMDTDKITLEAGMFIDVNDVNNYKSLDIPGIDRSFFEGIDRVEESAKKKIGIDDPLLGVKSGGTATENAIAAQSARTKLELFFTTIEEDTEPRDARLKVACIQQFYSVPEKYEPIVGEDGEILLNEFGEEVKTPQYRTLPLNIREKKMEMGEDVTYEPANGAYMELTPERLGVYNDRMANFTVKIRSRSTLPLSKELAQKKWLDMLSTISKIPQIAERVNWDKISTTTFEKFEESDSRYLQQEVAASEEMIQLAIEENDRIMKGEQIPPTKGATQEHTARHEALIKSTDFQQLPDKVKQILVSHYEGELAEQRMNEAQGQNISVPPGMEGMIPQEGGQPGGSSPNQIPASREETAGIQAPPQPETKQISQEVTV